MTACALVPSEINHTRHGRPSHFLQRRGLSIWINLDELAAADRQSFLFSVDKFNLLSFAQRDYGPNYRKKGPVQPLADYARELAARFCPDEKVAKVHMLTFPRILGVVFNPVSVYVLRDFTGRDMLLIYEVHNTFGDIHSYVGKPQAAEDILHAQKLLHVSPFFPVSGEYRLMVRAGPMDQPVRVLMRYVDRGKAQLTATLRGMPERLTTKGIVRGLLGTRQWPLRPLVSIHVEAMKLWMKRVTFFRRPEPPQPWSEAHHGMKK